MMGRARRADGYAGRVLTLLARDADVLALAVAFLELAADRARLLADDAVRLRLALHEKARDAGRQMVGLVAGGLAVAAADALVLVEDHRIVRLAAARSLRRGRKGGRFGRTKGHDARTGCAQQGASGDFSRHDYSPEWAGGRRGPPCDGRIRGGARLTERTLPAPLSSRPCQGASVPGRCSSGPT